MPVFRVQMPDGRVARIDAADGATALAFAKKAPAAPSDYQAEKAKAVSRDTIRDKANPGWIGALNDAAGEPLPLGDEIRGGMAALGNSVANVGRRVAGQPTVDSQAIYHANKDAENEHRAARNEAHPVASSVGGLLSGLAVNPQASGAKAASTLAPLAQKALGVAKGAGVGGLLSSIYSGADSEGSDRIGAAAEGFLPGAVWGGGLGIVGEAAAPVLKTGAGVVKDLVNTVRKPATSKSVEQAAASVAKLAASRGVTPATVRAAAQKFGDKPVTGAELMGREGVTNLAALGRRGGATPDALEATLRNRAQQAPTRIMGDAEQHLGVDPLSAQGDIEAMVSKGREKAGPMFDAALSGEAPVDSEALQRLSGIPQVQRAIKEAQQAAQTRARLSGTPDPSPDLTPKMWDEVKKGLGYQVERSPLTGKPLPDSASRGNHELGQIDRTLTGELRDSIPGYGDALDQSGDYLRLNSAFTRAKGKLANGTVQDFGKLWASLKTPAEQQAAKSALASDLSDLANRGLLKSGKLGIPGVQQKLELAFGRKGAADFLAKVDAEGELARYGSRMMPGGGSPTHELGAAEGDLGDHAGDLARVGGKLVRGNVLGAAADAIGTGFSKAFAYSKTTGMPAEVRDEMGRIYMLGPQDFEKFLQAHQVNPKVKLGQFFPTATLGGQLAVSQARQ